MLCIPKQNMVSFMNDYILLVLGEEFPKEISLIPDFFFNHNGMSVFSFLNTHSLIVTSTLKYPSTSSFIF